MTPLKEMYERLAELQAKENRFSEEESEIAELNTLIATREKVSSTLYQSSTTYG